MILERAAARLTIACTIGLAATLAQAQPRIVVVNGERLNEEQLQQLDRRNCAAVPSGRYWIDGKSGQWGYAGDTRARGVIGGACSRKPSASERRKLYRPGDVADDD